MSRFFQQRSKKTGLPPGTMIHIGERVVETTDITVFEYNEHSVAEKAIDNINEYKSLETNGTIKWINVDGIHDAEVLGEIGNYYGLHPLVMEDILNSDQRPKQEDYEGYLYIVAKMLYYDKNLETAVSEQLSIILGDNFVITFQEKGGDVFDLIRARLRSGAGRIRKMGADYLAYSILDAVVDNYFIVIEKLGDEIEKVEKELILKPTPFTLKAIHNLKREILFLHKSVRPLREVLATLERGESPLIGETTEVYLRDIYDHAVQVMDSIDTFREILSGMLDIYLSSSSNRMNEVMKVLTIISTIFMPLTFLAGVYGMNFKHMPELEWQWAYPVIWIVMILMGLTMFMYFKKKKWL